MIYVLLAIISSTAVSVFMRGLDSKIKNNMAMFATNYLICGALSFLFLEIDAKGKAFTTLSGGKGLGFAVAFGGLTGIFYLVSFVLLQYNIKKNGMILASLFMKLGVLVPVVMAMVVFGEQARFIQLLGFALAIIAIFIINLDGNKQKAGKESLWLIVLLLCGGFTDSTTNIFDKVGVAHYKNVFLLAIFAAAMLVSLGTLIIKKQKFTLWDALAGALIGIPNYFSSRFLLNALGEVPAIVVYPVYNVGAILLISLVGLFLFKEKLNLRKSIGMLVIIGAIILLNV